MKWEIEIQRQKGPETESYRQTFLYETEDAGQTLAKVLLELNRLHPEEEIRFEHSCHQKKCGACAMVIEGRPRLACDTVLSEFSKKKRLRIEPLHKFPVIADLIVDRSCLQERLKTMQVWAVESAVVPEKKANAAYDAARCLQCGLCLEVCPNYEPGGSFYGSAAFVPAAGMLAAMPEKDGGAIRAAYREHVFEGCGKSLACREICPAGIDMDHLLSRSNGMVLWRKHD